jgi:hypothetical protein
MESFGEIDCSTCFNVGEALVAGLGVLGLVSKLAGGGVEPEVITGDDVGHVVLCVLDSVPVRAISTFCSKPVSIEMGVDAVASGIVGAAESEGVARYDRFLSSGDFLAGKIQQFFLESRAWAGPIELPDSHHFVDRFRLPRPIRHEPVCPAES